MVVQLEWFRRVRNKPTLPRSLFSFSHQLQKEAFTLFPTWGQSGSTVRIETSGSMVFSSTLFLIISNAPLFPVSQSAVKTNIASLHTCYVLRKPQCTGMQGRMMAIYSAFFTNVLSVKADLAKTLILFVAFPQNMFWGRRLSGKLASLQDLHLLYEHIVTRLCCFPWFGRVLNCTR